MPRQTARLEEWKIMGTRAAGKVFGHPVMPDGKWIATSEIKNLDLVGKTIETKNTLYNLGKPMDDEAELPAVVPTEKDET